MLQLDTRPSFNCTLGQHCACCLARTRHKPHLVRFRERLCLGQKYLFWLPQTQLKMSHLFKNTQVCPHNQAWKLSWGLLRNIHCWRTSKCWNAVVTCRTPHHEHVMWAWCDTFCRNVNIVSDTYKCGFAGTSTPVIIVLCIPSTNTSEWIKINWSINADNSVSTWLEKMTPLRMSSGSHAYKCWFHTSNSCLSLDSRNTNTIPRPSLDMKLRSDRLTGSTVTSHSHCTFFLCYTHFWVYLQLFFGGSCGSGREPASFYRKVVGWIPLVCMSSVLGQDTEPQTAPDVLVGTLHGSHRHEYMYELLLVLLDKSVC